MSTKTIGQRIASEVKQAFQLTLYFGFWFSALTLLTHEILQQRGLPFEHWGLAWVKAALCAKFILIGQALYPMRHSNGRDLWPIVLPRSFAYLLIVLGLNVLEVGVEGLFRGEPFIEAVQHFANGSPVYAFALAWVYWMILVPFLLMQSLDRFVKAAD